MTVSLMWLQCHWCDYSVTDVITVTLMWWQCHWSDDSVTDVMTLSLMLWHCHRCDDSVTDVMIVTCCDDSVTAVMTVLPLWLQCHWCDDSVGEWWCLSLVGCELLDVVLTNDYLLILTSDGVYVSNDMSNSSSVNGVRMSKLNYTKAFDLKELGCSRLPVSLQDWAIQCVYNSAVLNVFFFCVTQCWVRSS